MESHSPANRTREGRSSVQVQRDLGSFQHISNDVHSSVALEVSPSTRKKKSKHEHRPVKVITDLLFHSFLESVHAKTEDIHYLMSPRAKGF